MIKVLKLIALYVSRRTLLPGDMDATGRRAGGGEGVRGANGVRGGLVTSITRTTLRQSEQE